MNVGLCGLGERLSYVAQTMSRLVPDFELVSYADPTPAKLDYMREHGINLRGYTELDDMLNKEPIDLLMIGSPNHLHLEHIRLGLEAGVKVFTEKPVVTTEEQTFELMGVLRKYGPDQVMVGMVLRYSQLYKDLKSAVESGQLGELSSIEATEHITPEHGAFYMRDWRRKTHYSGGFILEKCCHDLDLYQGIVGCRPSRVASFGGHKKYIPANADLEVTSPKENRTPRWGGTNDSAFNSDADIVDYQTALIEYENGTNLCFHTNLSAPDDFRRFCVFGSKGMAEGDFARNFFRVHDAPTSNKLIDKQYEHNQYISEHYGAEELMAASWSDHFSKGATLPVSILDALEAGLTAIKLDESRVTGQIIDMTETWRQFDSYELG